jgi:hypothetical protein
MDKIIELERLLKQYFKIINEAVDDDTKQQLPQPQQPQPPAAPKLIESGNKFIRFIGYGGYGCVFSPPKLITKIVKQEYPDPNINLIDINKYNEDYVAKILSCSEYSYKKEVESNMLIKKYDPKHIYTPEMIFAGYMNNRHLLNLIDTEIKTNKDEELTKLYQCLSKKLILNSTFYEFYGYIIYTRIGKSCENLTKDDINKKNIKEVLNNYSLAIKNFINNLYNDNLIHGDIKTPNMTLKDNKIYFIDFGLTMNYNETIANKSKVLILSKSINYPIILQLFNNIYDSIFNNLTKKEYLQLLETEINILNITDRLYLTMNTLISKHQFSIFKNIEDVKIYLKTYINQLLNAKLNDISKYTKKEVYTLCFSEIAKNIDIYSLSLVMFHMFYNNFYQQSFSPKDKDFTLSNLVTDKTLELISKLFEDALYNKIKDPIDLAERLDNIINKIE